MMLWLQIVLVSLYLTKKRRRKNTYKNNQNWIINVFFLAIMLNDSDNDNSLENILIKLNKENRIKEE